MTIKEIYLPMINEYAEKEWVDIHVINIYKASMSRTIDGNVISNEQMIVLGYYKPSGEIIENPLNEVIIKTMYDEKSGKFTNFSPPAGYNSSPGKKDREYLYPDNG